MIAYSFSEGRRAANVAVIERTQGQRPLCAPLESERTRAVPEGSGGPRLDLRAADVAWLPLDGPVVERAKMLLEREVAIAAREERTRALGR